MISAVFAADGINSSNTKERHILSMEDDNVVNSATATGKKPKRSNNNNVYGADTYPIENSTILNKFKEEL